MDAVVTQLQDALEGQIDFEGQRVTELLSTVLLISTSVVAAIVGFAQQDIHLAMWVILGGTVSTMLVVVPPWPFYNQRPQSWIGSKSKLQALGGGPTVASVKVN